MKLPKSKLLLPSLMIICLGYFFHAKYINEFPSHFHAWTQSDRYAISLGFVNNNLNFFKPEVLVYNRTSYFLETITAVDFPIHDYIPAIFMKILGNTSPWIFRLYILVYSFLGLLYLFRLTFYLTDSQNKGMLVVLFAATSPIFVYYQNGFLPTIPSLSNTIIGLYFYVKYLTGQKDKFKFAILFLTLATLSRMTFAIPLIAVFGYEFIKGITSKISLKKKILPVSISIFTILSYYFYNKYLQQEYGSIFLSHFLPAHDINAFKAMLKMIYKTWTFQYFSIYHYYLLAICGAIVLFYIIFQKENLKPIVIELFWFWTILLCGNLLFFILMIQQFQGHDYYFLDSFFIVFILIMILFLTIIPKIKVGIASLSFAIMLILIGIPMIQNAKGFLKYRRKPNQINRTELTTYNFQNADLFLDSLGISQKAKILVIDTYAPNIPFILMKRKGYSVNATTRENIKNSLSWNFDYIITQNKLFVSDIYTEYPEILAKISKIATNGRITVSKLSKIDEHQSLTDFIGYKDKTPFFREKLDFDSKNISSNWTNINLTTNPSFSPPYSYQLSKNTTYGLGYNFDNNPILGQAKSKLLFQAQILEDKKESCKIVFTIKEKNKTTFYKEYDLKNIIMTPQKWQKLLIEVNIPRIKHTDDKFSIYIWNPNHTQLTIDNVEISIYK